MVAYFPDLGRRSQIASGEHIRAIGWLAAGRAYAQGAISADALVKLRAYATAWRASGAALNWPQAAGAHQCELCGNCWKAGNFGVPAGDILYSCPEMLAHYVEAHSYCPPPEFVQALLAAPLPGTVDYETAVAQFRVEYPPRPRR